ncbi:MAG: MBL fold metallo-hydrolase [Clostridiales bacterium]|nr:MBL fold metallo-hydrolase [Clostridiales bacterium]
MNEFKFNGVGQGLFYSGTLFNGGFNFVFDCGTANKKSYLDEPINSYIQKISHGKEKPHIDFVIISHLHKDHFSGLPELAKNAVIDRLYLPYLGGNRDFIRFALAYAIFYDSDRNNARNFNENILLFNYMLKLYGLEDDLPDEERLDVPIPQRIIYGNRNINKRTDLEIGENEVICYNNLWRFELYFRSFNLQVIDDLLSRIYNLVGSFESAKLIDFICKSYNADAIKSIAKEYEAVFGKANHHKLTGGVNISSIVMVHYPLYYGAYALIRGGNVDNSDFKSDCVVTVLTGDGQDFDRYPCLIESVKEKDILFFQVPHHGAYDNWISVKKADFLKCKIEYFVLSFGLGNPYGHPHVNTVESLTNSKKCLYLITQLGSLAYSIDG